MKRLLRVPAAVWFGFALLWLCAASFAAHPAQWRASRAAERQVFPVYAYRQWQSTGIKLAPGDTYTLRATGEWQYSPIVGQHGPAGGRPAAANYPLPQVPGGALLARVGESGDVLFAGARLRAAAAQGGLLYLRINDDLLGDNQGVLSVEIHVVRAATPAP
jgi:hypothetical protein